MAEDKYKTQIEDFRNLKPYYDLIFEDIMPLLAKMSFERDIIKTKRALKEFIVNTSPYITDPKDVIKKINKALEKVLTFDGFDNTGKRYWNPNLSSKDLEKRSALEDEFFDFIDDLRIDLHENLAEFKFMPGKDKIRQKEQSKNTKGSSV